MFGIGPQEMVIVGLLALAIFGPGNAKKTISRSGGGSKQAGGGSGATRRQRKTNDPKSPVKVATTTEG